VKYVSTRGAAPVLGFADVLLAGLANDGGLYVPEEWPALPPAIEGATYAERAAQVMSPFVAGDEGLDDATLLRLCRSAYGMFRHPAVVPLVQIGDRHFVQELFHGPTLAFKDVALQLVGRLFDHVLGARGQRVTIVGATSGDTGSAAIDGVRACANVDIVILFPRGRVTEVQRRQMTTVAAPNVRCVAVDGTFDDCQDLVKAMFNDAPFRERMGLSAVNSINWARVMAQVVYYVVATDLLQGPLTFSVPTGNFGNVLSGWIARQMGAPVHTLIVGSNANDILTRFFDTRTMSTDLVVPTLSPSMDIQVSSNFERLLWEINGRNGALTAEQLATFRSSGELRVSDEEFERWITPVFRAARFDDEQTMATIADVHGATGMLIDPHTAVGVAAGRARRHLGVPVVTLATAHPAKFPDAVERATGVRPALPPALGDLFERPERIERLPNDLVAVQDFVRSVAQRPAR